MAMIAIKLFPESVDSLEHELVQEYLRILRNRMDAYDCKLKSFAIKKGTVFFSCDNQELMDDIVKELETITGNPAVICESPETFVRESKKLSD
jgi:hypothetical protein